MKEKIIKELQKLNNLDSRENINISNYNKLFNEINDYLLSDDPIENKNEVSLLVIEIVNYYKDFQDHLDELPNTIKLLFKSDENLRYIKILYEGIMNYDFVTPIQFHEILVSYLDFLEDENNDFYITNCYSKIEDFNKQLNDYLEKLDYNDNKFKDGLDEETIRIVKDLVKNSNRNK